MPKGALNPHTYCDACGGIQGSHFQKCAIASRGSLLVFKVLRIAFGALLIPAGVAELVFGLLLMIHNPQLAQVATLLGLPGIAVSTFGASLLAPRKISETPNVNELC